jgi:hypothetical protein
MYTDCDSHYFPVKFLEPVSAKYRHSPRVVAKATMSDRFCPTEL